MVGGDPFIALKEGQRHKVQQGNIIFRAFEGYYILADSLVSGQNRNLVVLKFKVNMGVLIGKVGLPTQVNKPD